MMEWLWMLLMLFLFVGVVRLAMWGAGAYDRTPVPRRGPHIDVAFDMLDRENRKLMREAGRPGKSTPLMLETLALLRDWPAVDDAQWAARRASLLAKTEEL